MYCDTWEVGDTVMQGFRIADQLGGALEQPDDYLISVCGTYWLDYTAGVVSGPIITENGGNDDACRIRGLGERMPFHGDPGEQPADVLTVRYEGGVPMISMSGVQGRAHLGVWDASGRRDQGGDGMGNF